VEGAVEVTSLTVDSHAPHWEPLLRHCMSPEGHLLTWYSSTVDGAVERQMFRFRTQPIADGDGEALRVKWSGTAD